MIFNKDKFFDTEFGVKLRDCIRTLDEAVEEQAKYEISEGEAYWHARAEVLRCLAQWEVYQLAMKQFYSIELHFTRTDDYFGLCTEDEAFFLMKEGR